MQKTKSLRANTLYNLLKTSLSLIFPVISFAYTSRVLQSDGLGRVQFAQSIVSYFILIAMLGIKNYGIREGAKRRENKEEFSKFTYEMFIVNIISTAIAYFFFFMSLIFINKFHDYQGLLLIFSITIGFTGIGLEWLYGAMEEYRYITMRSLAFQVISLAALLLLVKSKNDLTVYAWILCFSSVGSNALNLINARKFVKFKKYKLNLRQHLKPVLLLFAMEVSISLYSNLDSTMLGFLTNDTEVGLYAAAVKVNRVMVSIMSSVGVVLLPRLSSYVAKGLKDEFNSVAKKAFHVLLLFAVPSAAGLFILARPLVQIFSGAGYDGAVITMQLLTPIIIIIPLNTLINSQLLLPIGKENWALLSTCTSAGCNLITNSLLIPILARNGAAIGTIAAETGGLIVCLIMSSKKFNIKSYFKGSWQYFIAGLPIIPLGYLLDFIFSSDIVFTVLTVVLGIPLYILLLVVMKNSACMWLLEELKKYWLKFTRHKDPDESDDVI